MKRLIYILLVITLGGLVFTASPEQSTTAQQAQPIPSANEDVRIVAGLLLAQELLNIASTTAVAPDGMLKLATQPIQDKDPKWDGTGLTAQARAAAGTSGLARGELLLLNKDVKVTPTITLKNPLLQRAGNAQNNMLNNVYKAMIEAETAGQLELAYALASIYLTNGLFNFFNRGVENGLARIESCLSGQDVSLQISDASSGKTTEFPVECSKYKALRAVVATEVGPGAYSFLGPLVDIGCAQLQTVATQGKTVSLRLAAARAYVRGVQLFPGIFAPCIEPGEGQNEFDALLAAAQKAKEQNQQELFQEIIGVDYQLYNDGGGNPIAIYSSFVERRGLAKAVQQAQNIEALLESDDVGLAAYYDLADLWVNKPEAELRDLMANGKTAAARRAATKALLSQLGRAYDVQCLQSLANGQECK